MTGRQDNGVGIARPMQDFGRRCLGWTEKACKHAKQNYDILRMGYMKPGGSCIRKMRPRGTQHGILTR